MATRFNSFNASSMYAFAESKVKARNPIKKESVTPIIIITPTIRQVTKDQWNYHDGWLHSEHRVGFNRYDNNPEYWHDDIKRLLASLADVENADWESSNQIKPNFVIWLWQPIHEALSHVTTSYLSALTGAFSGNPPQPKNATVLTSIRIMSTSLLTGTGKAVPGFVENVRQIPITTEPLLLRQTGYTGTPVLATQPVPYGIEIAMRMTRIGEVYNPGVNYYWLPQPSLGQVFLESMEARFIDCVQENPAPTTRNRRVYVRLIENPGLERFTDPLKQDEPRRQHEMSPLESLIRTIEQYRSAKDVGVHDPCTGPGPGVDPKVDVDYPGKSKGTATWVTELIDILDHARPL